MTATPSPSPFPAGTGFVITAAGGTPPYSFVAMPVPPNPPGVVVDQPTNPAHVMVPLDTPRGTIIYVDVMDSSKPPQSVLVQNVVA